jgi:hypothetical protein
MFTKFPARVKEHTPVAVPRKVEFSRRFCVSAFPFHAAMVVQTVPLCDRHKDSGLNAAAGDDLRTLPEGLRFAELAADGEDPLPESRLHTVRRRLGNRFAVLSANITSKTFAVRIF